MNLLNELANYIFLRKILQENAFFLKNLHSWKFFYTTLGRDGCNKYDFVMYTKKSFLYSPSQQFKMQRMLVQKMFQYIPSKKYLKIQMPTKALFRMVGVFGVCVWYNVQVQLNDSEWQIGTQSVSRRLVDRFYVFMSVCVLSFLIFVF